MYNTEKTSENSIGEIHKYSDVPTVKDGRFTGTYLQWIKTQLSGWDNFPWLLFGLGAGFQLAVYILNPISWLTTISFIATTFGELCTVAMAAGGINILTGRRMFSHSINGLFGSISVVDYIIVNAAAGHEMSIFDQLIFAICIDIPLMFKWRTWGYGKNEESARKLTKKGWVGVIAAILLAWIAFYFIAIALHDTNVVWDSLTLAIGSTASVLAVKRISQTFTLWLASDIVNICLWFTTLQQGIISESTALLMFSTSMFYLISAIMGKINWR